MALPRSMATPRTLALDTKLRDAASGAMQQWPMPTIEDYTLIGAIVVLYSYAEFNLRRIAEALDYSDLLPEPWKGKAKDLELGQIEKAVRAAHVWSDQREVQSLQQLADLRPVRNMVAHFVVRRFPDDDAFLFAAKSAKDIRQVPGEDSDGSALSSVCERSEIIKVQKLVEQIQNWLAKVAPEFEERYGPPPQRNIV
jgi:hypothetical protein